MGKLTNFQWPCSIATGNSHCQRVCVMKHHLNTWNIRYQHQQEHSSSFEQFGNLFTIMTISVHTTWLEHSASWRAKLPPYWWYNHPPYPPHGDRPGGPTRFAGKFGSGQRDQPGFPLKKGGFPGDTIGLGFNSWMVFQMNGLFHGTSQSKMEDDWGYHQFRKPPNWAIRNTLENGLWKIHEIGNDRKPSE